MNWPIAHASWCRDIWRRFIKKGCYYEDLKSDSILCDWHLRERFGLIFWPAQLWNRPHQLWDYNTYHPIRLFHVGSGIKLRPSCLHGKHFINCVIFLALHGNLSLSLSPLRWVDVGGAHPLVRCCSCYSPVSEMCLGMRFSWQDPLLCHGDCLWHVSKPAV